jgi:hypothetical protein
MTIRSLASVFSLSLLTAGCATPPPGENCRYIDPNLLNTNQYKQPHPHENNKDFKEVSGKKVMPKSLAAQPFALEGDRDRNRPRWICEDPAPSLEKK